MTNIYVGNLSFDVSESQLQEAFAAHGTVNKASVVTDRMTGRSRGFGFVEMANDDEGNAAIEALNGSDLGGRALTVNLAKPKADRGRGGGGGGGRDRRW
jgi:RNA recognition motif-containing protein